MDIDPFLARAGLPINRVPEGFIRAGAARAIRAAVLIAPAIPSDGKCVILEIGSIRPLASQPKARFIRQFLFHNGLGDLDDGLFPISRFAGFRTTGTDDFDVTHNLTSIGYHSTIVPRKSTGKTFANSPILC